jgi:probable rRNA maturation factor
MVADIYYVSIANRQKFMKIPVGIKMKVRRTCNSALKLEKFKGSAEVNIVFVDNQYIKNLNKQYCGKDRETDVLSFQAGKETEFEVNPETGAKILGDIVISAEKALQQSEKFNSSFEREVVSLVAHGMLHLLGFDHKEKIQRSEMREHEGQILCSLGYPEIFFDRV